MDRPLREYEVDGVPVLCAPGRDPERCTATLMFRAGYADEVLATHGTTHLIEHLALHRMRRRAHQYNGWVDNLVCGFLVHGTEDEAVAFLGEVCAALRDLPLDRLDDEVQVLRAEERERGGRDLVGGLLSARFGGRGHGLRGWKPVGLRAVTPERVRAWAAERFTAANAVAWIDVPEPPARLRLELPSGPRRPPPRQPALPRLELPGRYAWERNAVGIAAVTPHSEALRVGMLALAHRATDELRFERGLVYGVDHDWLHLGHGQVHASLYAEMDESDGPLVRDLLLEAMTDMTAHGPHPTELAHAVRALTDSLREEHGDPRSDLDETARARLTDDPVHSGRELEAQLATIDAEQVRRALGAAFEAPLLGERAASDEEPPAGYAAIDLTQTEVPAGERWALRPGTDAPEGYAVVVGEEALAWAPADDEEGSRWAIRYDEVILVDDHPLLGLRVTNPDDVTITVCPTDHVDGERLVADLRARFGDLVVPVERFAALTRLRDLAQAHLPSVLVGSEALLAISDGLEDDEQPLGLARMTDSAGPGLLLVTDRAYLASTSPPEQPRPGPACADGARRDRGAGRRRAEHRDPRGRVDADDRRRGHERRGAGAVAARALRGDAGRDVNRRAGGAGVGVLIRCSG